MIGIGLIGAGLMGRNHARVISELDSRLIGVSDADAAAAEHAARRYGAAPYTDHRKLLANPLVDAVVVATPTVHHYAIARQALEAGKHVLVEKPMTTTVDEAESLIDLARARGLVLAVGHIERHNPVVRWLRDRVAQRTYGELVSMHSRRLSPYPERIRDVGVVMDLGIHDLDILSYIAGEVPVGLYATARSHHKEAEVEDHAGIMLDFARKTTAYAELSWLTPTKVRTLTLTCEEGVIESDYMEQSVSVSRSTFGRIDPDNAFHVPIEFTMEKLALRREEPLRNEHLDFQQAVRDGRAPLVDGREGLKALRLAQAVIQSAKSQSRVALQEA